MTCTHEQAIAALEIGNRIRQNNAEWKQRLFKMPAPEGCALLADVLEDPKAMNGHLGSIRVAQALTSLRRIADGKADRMMIRAGIHNGQRALRDLAPRQRQHLVLELRIRAHTR